MYHEACLSFLAVTPLFACADRRSGLLLRRQREVSTAFVPFGGVHGGLPLECGCVLSGYVLHSGKMRRHRRPE
jgi:hypothetical protein